MAATAEPAIARLVGEGMDKPNADRELPLDIMYGKLIDWLVGAIPVLFMIEIAIHGVINSPPMETTHVQLARQKLPKDWNKRLQSIQAKAAEAIKEPAAQEVPLLMHGASLMIGCMGTSLARISCARQFIYALEFYYR